MLFYGPLIVKNIEMFLRGLKSTQKSIHDTEAETEKEEEVRLFTFTFYLAFGSTMGPFLGLFLIISGLKLSKNFKQES